MARLLRSRHALDAELARGRSITMTTSWLNTGPARMVVTVAGQPPIALAAALGRREQERDRSGAG
jgi:hypothetical protein